MAATTGVVDLTITDAGRHPGYCTFRSSVASSSTSIGRIILDIGCVVNTMAIGAIVTRSITSVMMDATSWEVHNRVTGQTSCRSS